MTRWAAALAVRFLCVLSVCLAGTHLAYGQNQRPDKPSAPSDPAPLYDLGPDETLTIFSHSESSRYWISGQPNFISQCHPAFHSPSHPPHTLSPQPPDP